MRIIAIDLAGVCRRFFELDKGGSLSEGSALVASINYITRASEGFDRVVIARDVRPSFRKQICATYKAGREDPGPVYEKLEKDVAVRAWKDGAAIFPATSEESAIKIGDGYPEADDVLASLAHWYRGEHLGGWELVLLSQDGDICSLVSDEFQIMVRRFDGEIWTKKEVFEKLGYGPGLVVHVKALAGDTSDKYKPFPHYDAKPDDKSTLPGIGDKKAVALLEKWGSYGDPMLGLSMGERVLLAAQDGAAQSADPSVMAGRETMPDGHERKCLVAGGTAALKLGYACATMLNALQLDFSRILKEPVKRSLTAPKEPVQAAETTPDEPPVVSAPMIVKPVEGIQRPRRDRNQIERYALQPRNDASAIAVATEIFNARLFPQYTSWQAVFVAIAQGNEHGVPMITSLDQGYVVHGRLARSAAYLVGLVKKSGKCKTLTVLQTTHTECTGAYRNTDDELGPHFLDMSKCTKIINGNCACPHVWTFTIKDAQDAGWTKSRQGKEEKKWVTEPLTMLPWAWYRMSCRRGWPEITGGVVTKAELTRDGSSIDAEGEELMIEAEAIGDVA